MQPEATNGAVANPNSSAPNRHAIATSRPVFNCPSHSKTILFLKSFITKVCCASAIPSSHGKPACLNDVKGDAPVPPSNPEIKTTSALAFATPDATVPTPTSETNFTLMENHNYSLSDLENMMPWEREVYVALLVNYLKEKEQQMRETQNG